MADEAFGSDPAFSLLVAEVDGEVVGYAMYYPGYNSDRQSRSITLEDLFVVDAARGRGVGRALMAAVAAEAVRRGAGSVVWGVRDANQRAQRFYAGLGARDVNARIFELHEPALSTLAGIPRPPKIA